MAICIVYRGKNYHNPWTLEIPQLQTNPFRWKLKWEITISLRHGKNRSVRRRLVKYRCIEYCIAMNTLLWSGWHLTILTRACVVFIYTHNMIPLMQVAYENLVCGHLTHAIHVVVHFHNKLRSYSLHTFPHTCTLLPTVFNRGARSWMWYPWIQSYTIILYIYGYVKIVH